MITRYEVNGRPVTADEYARVVADLMPALLDRLEVAEAAVERVETALDELRLTESRFPIIRAIDGQLRAALAPSTPPDAQEDA